MTQLEKALKTTSNLFVTGPAGTGKTYSILDYIKDTPNVLVCASTGIAALNIGGDTAHRVFHIPVPAFEPPSFARGKKGAITKAQLALIAQADVIVVEEVSMLRSDAFRYMIKVIRKAEKLKGKKIRLIAIGDFSQLPPVVKKDEAKLFKKYGLDPSGFAFTTQEWKSCNFKTIELTEVKRQENAEFVNILNEIRLGERLDLGYFDKFVDPNPDYDSAICICGTNAEADRINREYLDSLSGTPVALQSTKEGHCMSGYVDDVVVIKEGAKVVFIANDNIFKKYRNGTFGVVKYINADSLIVDINGKEEVITKRDFPIYAHSVCNGTLTKKELGKISQYPIKIGKAITIHKSQGQTFDKVIISPEIFAPGQLYVALSRVRTPEGLTLLRDILPEHLIIAPEVQTFYDNRYTWEVKKTAKKAAKPKAEKKPAAKKKATAKTGAKKTTKTAKAKSPVKKATSITAKTTTKKIAKKSAKADIKKKRVAAISG